MSNTITSPAQRQSFIDEAQLLRSTAIPQLESQLAEQKSFLPTLSGLPGESVVAGAVNALQAQLDAARARLAVVDKAIAANNAKRNANLKAKTSKRALIEIKTDKQRQQLVDEAAVLRSKTIPDVQKEVDRQQKALTNAAVRDPSKANNRGTLDLELAKLIAAQNRLALIEASIAANPGTPQKAPNPPTGLGIPGSTPTPNPPGTTPPAGTKPVNSPGSGKSNKTGETSSSNSAASFLTQDAGGIPVYAWFIIGGLLLLGLIAGLLAYFINKGKSSGGSSSQFETNQQAPLYGRNQFADDYGTFAALRQ
jgi:hypothetical protein